MQYDACVIECKVNIIDAMFLLVYLLRSSVIFANRGDRR